VDQELKKCGVEIVRRQTTFQRLLMRDWVVFEPALEQAANRFAARLRATIQEMVCGLGVRGEARIVSMALSEELQLIHFGTAA
jgi:hypothetical protein